VPVLDVPLPLFDDPLTGFDELAEPWKVSDTPALSQLLVPSVPMTSTGVFTSQQTVTVSVLAPR
jgi:hypothetical protein